MPPNVTPQTRLAVLSQIMKWIKWEGDLDSFIMWLYGPAGAGKSAIAQTIAEMCEEEMILLASFFFSRTDPSCNSVRPLIATIAYQIIVNFPDVRDAILRAVQRDPLIFSKALTIQFKSLIVEPLRQLVEAGFFNESNSRRLVIIDGIDECFDPKVQRNILEVLANAQRQHHLPLIFLFASRPEEHISDTFNTTLLLPTTTRIALDKCYLPGDDIRLTDRLNRDIPRQWPPPNIPQLIQKAPVFRGPRRKLVLAFYIGTKYSNILYRFPAPEHISGDSKIPTIIYYDRAGKVKAVGAETLKEGIYETAEDEHWVKVERFELYLQSRVDAGRQVANEIPPLPLNKTVVEVFADFLAYLLEYASSYIQDTHLHGADLWASVKDQIYFVLSQPNGWEVRQQGEIRKAAILAKLVPDTPAGHARLSFVTEGEASLHFSVQNGLPIGAMKDGDGVVPVDAGEETVDINSYGKNVGETKHTLDVHSLLEMPEGNSSQSGSGQDDPSSKEKPNPSSSSTSRRKTGVKESLMDIALSTIERLSEGSYRANDVDYDISKAIQTTVKNTQFYAADSRLFEWHFAAPAFKENEARSEVKITVTECSTLVGARMLKEELITAEEDAKMGKIGVLNFASAKKPGGQFFMGAQGQEESIARSSTIFPSLLSQECGKFYRSHTSDPKKGYYSHAMIYSPRVLLMRSDNGDWLSPVEVEVVTSCAVNAGVVRRYLRKRGSEDESDLDAAMKERMARILYLFEKQGVRNLVLGSFGTGVLRNRVELVANIWKELLVGRDARFKHSFDRVEFSILGNATYDAFKRTFSIDGVEQQQ